MIRVWLTKEVAYTSLSVIEYLNLLNLGQIFCARKKLMCGRMECTGHMRERPLGVVTSPVHMHM